MDVRVYGSKFLETKDKNKFASLLQYCIAVVLWKGETNYA